MSTAAHGLSAIADRPQRVLIAGAGVGGLEAALSLRALAPGRVDVTLLAPDRHFTYRPLSVGEPFGRSRTVQVELSAIADDRGFTLVRDAVGSVAVHDHQVMTQEGHVLGYDGLLLSLGTRATVAVPGALTFRGPRDAGRLTLALEAVAGLSRPRVVFVAAAGSTWTLPLYELALLTVDWAERRGVEADVSIVTAEERPLAAFGVQGSERVAALLERRGINVRSRSVAEAVDDGRLWIPMEGYVPGDLFVALPYLAGPAVRGLPHDAAGFVPVDRFGRVVGAEDVYAVGDMTSHELKQGGLAAQQADVAARAIAAAAGEPVAPEPYAPVLRGLLLTGGEPLYLRNPPGDDPEGAPGDVDRVSPWWPPHKIVGAQLAPYLATHADLMVPVTAA